MTNHFIAILVLLILPSVANAQDFLRIGSWNTANKPNTAEADDAFFHVITELGVPDILAIQETDTGSSASILSLFNQQQPENPFSIFATSSDSGGDRTALIFNTDRVQLLESIELSSGLTHTTARASFLPTFSAYATPVTIYSVHLNSGVSDAGIRGVEATILAADAATVEDENILFAGDFNLLSSDEAAWANIGGDDLADAPGDWRDNAAFKSLHTQNPGSAMDDRFDFMFNGGGLTDGIGFDYIPDSFTVFGNDGSHSLNDSIDTGTGESPDVLQSLIVASDHLPIFADFQFIPILGDFDRDGDVDADDIDFYNGNLGQSASFNDELDLDTDGTIALADHDQHVTTLVQTSNGEAGALIGDIDLDGDVDVLVDAFILVGNLGNAAPFGYADGDLNADGIVSVLGDAFRLVGNLGMSNAP